MKIVVDEDRCEANQRCMKMIPEVFQVGDDDKLRVLVVSPGPDLLDRVKKAVRGCPRQALSLVDE